MSPLTLGTNHVPDILDCLAQLSNDEVPTPPKLAQAMLDLLPADVWTNPDLKWLDPFTKSGVFLREIAIRLLDGLTEWQPDFEQRRDHIFRNMLYGNAITEMTGHIARRTVYCSRDASGPHSVVRLTSADGNVPFVPALHTFAPDPSRCKVCGAPADLERGGSRENYAYSFIHGAYPTEEVADVKFDVIVGNPPYQIDSNGNTRTMPIYQLFVDAAIALAPRHIVMITRSRWFTGGLGLEDFRTRMIADRHLSAIVDNPKLFDCFPGVEIKGGVSYFHWDRDHNGDCTFSTRIDGKIRSTVTRDLRDGEGVLVRDNSAAGILQKVRAKPAARTLGDVVSSRIPFGASLTTNFKGDKPAPFAGSIPLILSARVGYVSPQQLERNHDWVNRWKVLLPKAGDGHGREEAYVIGEPIALAPGSACSDTYLVAGLFDSEKETRNYANFLVLKLVRFLILQRKSTQDLTPDRFQFVPMLDMKRAWTDQDLYDHFGLTAEERDYVDQAIKERSVNLSLDSPVPATHLPGGSKHRSGRDAQKGDE